MRTRETSIDWKAETEPGLSTGSLYTCQAPNALPKVRLKPDKDVLLFF